MKNFYFTLLLIFAIFCLNAQNPIARNAEGNRVNSGTIIKILKAFPNPATTYITFEFQRNYLNGLSLEIYNLPGKRVASASNLLSSTTIQLQNFYRGVYIYKLLDRYGKVLESGKFQVVK
jgi:hypothetical protein